MTGEEGSIRKLQDRTRALEVLKEIFARPVPPPFDKMTEEEIMATVEAEIAAARSESPSAEGGSTNVPITSGH